MQDLLVAAGLFVAAFLLGSIPWGLVISTVFFHTDIRQHGSGNIGTTNAMRTIGKAGGAAVFVLDFGKGLLSGVLAWAFSQYLLPGIAVAVGCLFVTFGWVGACLELLIFAVLVVATKHVSVGSIAAAAACPFFALYFFWGDWLAWACCTIAAVTVVWAHRGNIARLRAGTESRIGQKKEA